MHNQPNLIQKYISEECRTIKSHSCVFPFVYKGSVYDACTKEDSDNGAAWCAVQVLMKNVLITKNPNVQTLGGQDGCCAGGKVGGLRGRMSRQRLVVSAVENITSIAGRLSLILNLL